MGSPFKNVQKMKFEKANRERYDKMSQKTKDSLQVEAWKYGGPFWSPKHQVNVDPEDGVLYNRPIYKDGTMLTYPSLSKPTSRETEINKPSNPLNKGRCWDGYEPTPGKKAYEDGSCQPIKRQSALNVTEKAYEKQNKKMRSDHKKETGSTLGDRQTSGTGSRRVSFACRFAGMDGSMTEDNGEPSRLAMALKKWGFSSKGEASSFCNSNKKS